MKFHESSPAGRNAFTGYGDDYVLVNGERFEAGILVLPEGAVRPWPVKQVSDLTPDRISELAGLGVEVVLIGTGRVLRFPAPALLQPLTRARIGAEIMDTAAACRTYNILMAEGRKVAAALMLGA